MKKRKLLIAVVTGIVLMAGVVWAFMTSGTDSQVEKVKQMQAVMFKQGTLPDPAKLTELREAEKQLSSTQRQEIDQNRRQQFQRRIGETVSTYFSLPKEKRTAFLDERIKEMEKWRAAREAARGESDASANGQGGGGPFAGGQGGSGGPGGGGTGGQGGPGGAK